MRNKLIKLIKPPLSTRFDRVCHPFPKASKEPVLVFLALTVTIGRSSPPDFLWNLVALTNFMRLSLLKGARAASSSAAWQEIRVRGWIIRVLTQALKPSIARLGGTAEAVPFVQSVFPHPA